MKIILIYMIGIGSSSIGSNEQEIKKTKKMMKCIVTTFLVFGIDVIIKLFINYYGPLSFFFRPLKPLYLISTLLFNLFFSPVFWVFILHYTSDDDEDINLKDIILPPLKQNQVFSIFILLRVYVFIFNVTIPILFQIINHKTHFLYKNVTKNSLLLCN